MELRIPVPLDDPDAEIHIRMRHHETRLVFFAVVLTLRDEKGEWRESCSVDTDHGALHLHHTGHREPDDSREMRPLYSERDVGESWEVGYGAIHTRYLEWRSTRR